MGQLTSPEDGKIIKEDLVTLTLNSGTVWGTYTAWQLERVWNCEQTYKMSRGTNSRGCTSSLVWMDLTRSTVSTLDRELGHHQGHLMPWLIIITCTLVPLTMIMTRILETVQWNTREDGGTTAATTLIWMASILHPIKLSVLYGTMAVVSGFTTPVWRWKCVPKPASTHSSASSNYQQGMSWLSSV